MAKRSELNAAQRREAVLALLRREAAAAVLARRFFELPNRRCIAGAMSFSPVARRP